MCQIKKLKNFFWVGRFMTLYHQYEKCFELFVIVFWYVLFSDIYCSIDNHARFFKLIKQKLKHTISQETSMDGYTNHIASSDN